MTAIVKTWEGVLLIGSVAGAAVPHGAREGFLRDRKREGVAVVWCGGVWEVGREMIVDWAWREAVEIASCRPMRGTGF